eukprot:Sdes_comp18481_c0_seq1m8470
MSQFVGLESSSQNPAGKEWEQSDSAKSPQDVEQVEFKEISKRMANIEEKLLIAEERKTPLEFETFPIIWHGKPTENKTRKSAEKPSSGQLTSEFRGTKKPGKKTIIFDCGNVLFYHSRLGIIREMGLGALLCYTLSTLSSPKRVFDLAFEVMFTLGVQQISTLEEPFVTHQGEPLPAIMFDWLAGVKTNAKVLEQLGKQVEVLYEGGGFFTNGMEKNLTLKALQMIFTPESNVKNVYCLSKGIEIVKRCKDAGHQTMILSNWDSESFELVKKKYPLFFEKYIDHIIISGEVHMNKPHACIYKLLLSKYDLDPDTC